MPPAPATNVRRVLSFHPLCVPSTLHTLTLLPFETTSPYSPHLDLTTQFTDSEDHRFGVSGPHHPSPRYHGFGSVVQKPLRSGFRRRRTLNIYNTYCLPLSYHYDQRIASHHLPLTAGSPLTSEPPSQHIAATSLSLHACHSFNSLYSTTITTDPPADCNTH